MAQSNAAQEDLEATKKEHPDWIVGGQIYSDPEEREAARQALAKLQAEEEKKKQEQEQLEKEEANAIETERGKVIGSDASVAINNDLLKEAIGDIDYNAALGNSEEIKKRQHILDPSNYDTEIKTPNPGKMPNNEDPFPVDLKIEELEVHKPDIKIYQLTVPNECREVAKAVLKVSDTAEKRIVKLENMMATLYRYLFRIGSRMSINCQYYGGQTSFEKYKCIRCLVDNRTGEGQEIQLDQCLTCTRYEPIYGQVYEIMNDLGSNVASILDDNQMSYNNMDNYVEQNKVEKYHNESEKANIDLATVQLKSDTSYNDREFKQRWGNGIAMDWKLVPKEQQKPHINWRQSINDDGSNLKRLASFPMNEQNAGSNLVTAGKTMENIFIKNKQAMDLNSNSTIQNWISTGKQQGENVSDTLINKIKGGWAKEIRSAINGQQGLDSLAIACCAFISNNDPSSIISKLVDIKGVTGVDNPALNIAAYMSGINAIMGDESSNIPRIDKVTKPNDNSITSTETYHLNWENRDTWYWTEFAEPLSINAKKNGESDSDVMPFFPKICYLYCALLPYCKTSEYDGEWAAFPFDDNQIQNYGITFTSKYGPRGGRIHHGIDLGAPHGTEIHAIQDGIVIDPSGWGAGDCNAIIVDHGNGVISKYLHCSSHAVGVGTSVSKGDIIAYVGGWGKGHDGTYSDHLHLEIGTNGLDDSNQNPIDYYPLLADCQPERGDDHYYDLANHVMY